MHRVTSKILLSFDASCNIIFRLSLNWLIRYLSNIYFDSMCICICYVNVYAILMSIPYNSFSLLETANAICVLTSIAPYSAVRFIILLYPSMRFAVAIRNSNLSNVSYNWAIIAPVIIKYERRDSSVWNSMMRDCSQEIRIALRRIKFAQHAHGTFVECIFFVHPGIYGAFLPLWIILRHLKECVKNTLFCQL